MPDVPAPPSPVQAERLARQQREARALRENLLRRKAARRPDPAPADPPEDGPETEQARPDAF